MASQTPAVEMATPTASGDPPPSRDSVPASSTSSPALETEVEALSPSHYTPLDNSAESTGHAVERETPIGSNGNEVVKDLDLLADTVRSIVTDVANSAGDGKLTDEGATAENVAEETLVAVVDGEVTGEATSVSRADTGSSGQTVVAIATAGSGSDAVALTRRAPDSEEPTRAPKRQKRCEYSDETRALCVSRHQTDGASYATISKEMGIPHDTVRAIVRKAKRTGTVSSAPRSGRPRKTSGIVDKVILEAVKANKQCSAKSIQEELLRVFGVKISAETVRRRVLDHTKQRMQSISTRASSEGAVLPGPYQNTTCGAASEAMLEGRRPTALPDSVSFQELLHGEAASGLPSSSVRATISVPAVVEPAISVSSPPSFAPTIDDAVVPACPPQVQQPQPEGESLSKKRPKRGEYSIETREQCVALHAQGQGYRKIGKALNMPHTTVRAIVEKAQRTGTVLPAKRSGRPRKTDEIVDKVILQAVKANEKSSARMIKEQLLAAYGVHVSCETIRRRVKDHSRQCMFASSTGIDADSLLAQQQTSQEQEVLASVMTASSVPAASLMTFDENGVHI